jgi:RNA-binding protein 5/10
MPEKENKVYGKKHNSEGPPSPPPPPHPLDLGKDENNVGNKLLKLMGWKEGQGLGTEGEGRVEPMYVLVYP